MDRLMVTVRVTHDGGWIEQTTTDDPKLLGEWIVRTAHKMPERERSLSGNWHDGGWIEQTTTDDPKLLGEWIVRTAHKMPERERSLRGNWHVSGWVLPQ